MELSFEECVRLAKKDPDAFENYRIEMIKQVIDRARPECQQRMKGLQFQIDMERRKTGTPMASCLRLNEIMMNFLYDEFEYNINIFLSKKKLILSKVSQDDDKRATILPFPV